MTHSDRVALANKISNELWSKFDILDPRDKLLARHKDVEEAVFQAVNDFMGKVEE